MGPHDLGRLRVDAQARDPVDLDPARPRSAELRVRGVDRVGRESTADQVLEDECPGRPA